MFRPSTGKTRTGPLNNTKIVSPPFKPLADVEINPEYALPAQSSIFPITTFSQLNFLKSHNGPSVGKDSMFLENMNYQCNSGASKLKYSFGKYNSNSTILMESISQELTNIGYSPKKTQIIGHRDEYDLSEMGQLSQAAFSYFFSDGKLVDKFNVDLMTKLKLANSYIFLTQSFTNSKDSSKIYTHKIMEYIITALKNIQLGQQKTIYTGMSVDTATLTSFLIRLGYLDISCTEKLLE